MILRLIGAYSICGISFSIIAFMVMFEPYNKKLAPDPWKFNIVLYAVDVFSKIGFAALVGITWPVSFPVLIYAVVD